nr:MAG TPA: hypothetical protein [Crassvirales sp.]DAS01520.1 MAG TPA: hypothetical protein [Caudoviricetes sp.]
MYSIFIYCISLDSFNYILPPYPLISCNVDCLCLSCGCLYDLRFYL